MKKILNYTFVAAGFYALTFAVPLQAQTPRMMDADTDMPSETNMMPLTAQGFVWIAATTDMKEIHLGELALQTSDNADVKRFAKHIVAAHKKACKKLKAIAEKQNLNFPDTNSMAWNMNDRWHTNSMESDGMTNSITGQFQHPPVEKIDMDSPPHLASLLTSNTNAMDDSSMNGQKINWNALSGTAFDQAFASHMVMGHKKAIQKFEDASANLSDAALKKYADKTLPTLRNHLRMAEELQSKVGMWSDDSSMTNSMPRTQ